MKKYIKPQLEFIDAQLSSFCDLLPVSGILDEITDGGSSGNSSGIDKIGAEDTL